MGAFVGMGTLFLLGEAFAVAIAAALVGAVIVGAVVVFAAICWIAFFFKAAGARDWWWFADLVLTPLVGLLAGIFISQHTAALDAWAMGHGARSGCRQSASRGVAYVHVLRVPSYGRCLLLRHLWYVVHTSAAST